MMNPDPVAATTPSRSCPPRTPKRPPPVLVRTAKLTTAGATASAASATSFLPMGTFLCDDDDASAWIGVWLRVATNPPAINPAAAKPVLVIPEAADAADCDCDDQRPVRKLVVIPPAAAAAKWETHEDEISPPFKPASNPPPPNSSCFDSARAPVRLEVAVAIAIIDGTGTPREGSRNVDSSKNRKTPNP